VPPYIIEQRDKITVQEIMKESNTEIRRAMRNLYGMDRFMHDAGAKVIDSCPQHNAKLLALHLPNDPVEIRMMEMECPSTGNRYMERVPPDVRSALEGLSWRFQVAPAQYKPDLET
jgi:hypothetical protein